MAPVRRNLSHRGQHKAPLMHAGVRQDQLIWRRVINRSQAQRHKPFNLCPVWRDQVAISYQVKVAASRFPPISPNATQLSFDLVESSEYFSGAKGALYQSNGVDEIIT